MQAVKQRVHRAMAVVAVVFLVVAGTGIYLVATDKASMVGSLLVLLSALIAGAFNLWVRRQPPPYGSG